MERTPVFRFRSPEFFRIDSFKNRLHAS
jgi:hypothetical protein